MMNNQDNNQAPNQPPKQNRNQRRAARFRKGKNDETAAVQSQLNSQPGQVPAQPQGQRQPPPIQQQRSIAANTAAKAKAAPALAKIEATFGMTNEVVFDIVKANQNLTVAKGLELYRILDNAKSLSDKNDYRISTSMFDAFIHEYATRVQVDYFANNRIFALYNQECEAQYPMSKLAVTYHIAGNSFKMGRSLINEVPIAGIDVVANPNLIQDAAGRTSLGKYLTIFPDAKMWLYLIRHRDAFLDPGHANHAALVQDLIDRIENVVAGYNVVNLQFNDVPRAVRRLIPRPLDVNYIINMSQLVGVSLIGDLAAANALLGVDDIRALNDVKDLEIDLISKDYSPISFRTLCETERTGSSILEFHVQGRADALVYNQSDLFNYGNFNTVIDQYTVGPFNLEPNPTHAALNLVSMKYDWTEPNDNQTEAMGIPFTSCFLTLRRARGPMWNRIRDNSSE